MTRDTSATLAAMRRARVPVTLENWLAWNLIDPSALLDSELLEIVPERLRGELQDQLRFQNVYEGKFETWKAV